MQRVARTVRAGYGVRVNWIVAAASLAAVIVLHELGHFLCARFVGMRVDRFNVFGIGPTILRLGRWRETEFVLGAIPFGAAVEIRGMAPEEEGSAPPEPGDFRTHPIWARALVLAGGPLANYLVAMVLLFTLFTTAGMPGRPVAIEVGGVRDGSAAQAAGIQLGDTIAKIGDVTIDPGLAGRDVIDAGRRYRGTTTTVEVERAGEHRSLAVTVPDVEAPLGIVIGSRPGPRQAVSLATAVSEAVARPIADSKAQLQGLWQLVTGRLQATMQGPVGIVREIARSADGGIVPLVMAAALISTLLGLFNLIPLPGLDGGRLAFVAYEAITRRRANPRVEELVHAYGLMALLLLIALATVGDVRRLF
jgi:regulator of sigma E protease